MCVCMYVSLVVVVELLQILDILVRKDIAVFTVYKHYVNFVLLFKFANH